MEKFRKKAVKALPYIIAPAAVMLILLINYYQNHIFPFGKGTVAWCDMTQQVIPLLIDLKDILAGKSGVFLNLQNAGGMNLWGVIFFFLASPFSLLVMFVKKTDMIYFVNILVMLKLMTCSVTSVFFLKKRITKLSATWCVILSIMYAFSGYAMLYYQNVIWLDMMYLFPLLMYSYGELIERKRIAPYTAVLTLMMIVNYYISYMIVIFTLMFMGIITYRYRSERKYRQGTVYFIIGSALGAFLSAVVWLPCFAQYLSSGRREGIFSEIKGTTFFTQHETTLPTVMLSAVVIVIIAAALIDARPRSKKQNTYLILTLLMTLPLIIEPINMMWHTGTYMSFPSRYGFISEYMLIITASLFITDDENRAVKPNKSCDNLPLMGCLMLILYSFTKFVLNYTSWNREMLSAYTRSLWGDKNSFHAMLQLFVMAALVYLIFFGFYKKGYLSKDLLSVFCAVMIAAEAFSNVSVYVTMPNKNNPKRAQNQRAVVDLADRIDDDSGFYRVSTGEKYFDVNLVGSMGYNSISHYTSLTSEDYMFMMKKLGYSSYWMEVGSYGATELSDALMNIKYNIRKGKAGDDAVYSNDKYVIEPKDIYLPSGLVLDKELKGAEKLPKAERGEIQQFVYENTLGDEGDELITFYECDEPKLIKQDDKGRYVFKKPKEEIYVMDYTVHIEGRQSLYFDCFDKLSNSLYEDINDCFAIYVNYIGKGDTYPSQEMNGLVKLGEFENQTVDVKIELLKSCKCTSFGVFSLDLDKLEQSADKAKTVNFKDKKGKLTGEYEANGGETCLLSIPYSDDLDIKINGESVKYSRAFDDLVSFKLKQGKNSITVTSMPKGFKLGAVVSIAGIALCVVYGIYRRKLKFSETVENAAAKLIIGIGAVVITAVYIVPVIVNFRN